MKENELDISVCKEGRVAFNEIKSNLESQIQFMASELHQRTMQLNELQL